MIAWLASIAAFAFVMAATPGPNNVLFAASGARVGYLRTTPGLVGMLSGFAVILAACSAGLAQLVARDDRIQVAMTLLASGYLVWLGQRLWRAPAPEVGGAEGALLTWRSMAIFQVANPKTWLAAVAFTSGFLAARSPGGPATDLLGVLCFLVVVLLSASAWTLVGSTVGARLNGRRGRLFNRALAVVAVGTVVTFWT